MAIWQKLVTLVFLFCGFENFQVLQQCILCKSGRNHHRRDELPWSGFPFWIRVPFKCHPYHFPQLLCIPAKADVVGGATTKFSRILLEYWSKVTKAPIVFQWRWSLTSTTTTATSCLKYFYNWALEIAARNGDSLSLSLILY